MASDPKMEYHVGEKGLPCWLSQFIKAKLTQPTGQNFFPNFTKDFSHLLQT